MTGRRTTHRSSPQGGGRQDQGSMAGRGPARDYLDTTGGARHQRVLALALVLIALVGVAVLITGCGSDEDASASSTSVQTESNDFESVPAFVRLPSGWYPVPAEQPHSPSLPGEATDREATALNWNFQPTGEGWGRGDVFVGDRIAVTAILLCPRPPGAGPPPGTLPLPVTVANPPDSGQLEGVPNTTEYRFQPTVSGVDLDVRVAFASPEPTPAMIASAQEVVDGGLRVPKPFTCP